MEDDQKPESEGEGEEVEGEGGEGEDDMKGDDGEENKGNELDNKIKNPDIAMLFNPNRDVFPSKPYYEDGNPDLYSDDNLLKRTELKTDPTVSEAIRDFINLFKKSSNGSVTKEEYFRVFMKIGMILRPNTDPDELQKLIKDDFDREFEQMPAENQNSAHDSISGDRLYDSLYELADIWCPNVDSTEIKAFFEALKFRFRYEGQKDTSAYDVL